MKSKNEEGLLTTVFDGKNYTSYYSYKDGWVTVDCGDAKKSVHAEVDTPMLAARELMRELVDNGACQIRLIARAIAGSRMPETALMFDKDPYSCSTAVDDDRSRSEMKIIAVNGSPRKHWNTAMLLEKRAWQGQRNKALRQLFSIFMILILKGASAALPAKSEGAKATEDVLSMTMQSRCTQPSKPPMRSFWVRPYISAM